MNSSSLRSGIPGGKEWPARAARIALLLVAALISASIQAQSVIPPPDSVRLASWHLGRAPNDIAVNPEDGTFAVVDAGNGDIQLLRPGGTHMGFRRGFRDPRSAAYLPGGVLLVGEAGTGTVRGYDPDGGIVLTLGAPEGEFLTPNDIAVDPVGGRIYVADSASHRIKVYGLADGAPILAFGSEGTGDGEFRFPISVAVNPALDEVFVGDSRNRRISVFDAGTGEFHRHIGAAGGDDGQISFIGGLFMDDQLRLYAVESLGGFVQIFDPEGGFIGRIGEHGRGEGRLRSPKAVLIDPFHRLLVTSYLDRKIEVWGLDEFDNPIDEEILVFGSVIPAHIKPGRETIRVVFQVAGFDPAEIAPGSLRINEVVRPYPDSYRMGPHLSVRFPTDEVLATLPPGTLGDVILRLSGRTLLDLDFGADLTATVVPPSGGSAGEDR